MSLDDAVWQLRCQLKDREATLEARISKAEVGSCPWHQLEGQLLELHRIMRRLADLPN